MEKMDLDLQQFIEMFEIAMNSDNPTVSKCFSNLMLVVSLVHAEDKEKYVGPLSKLVERVDALEKSLAALVKTNTGGYTNTYPYTTTTPFVYDNTIIGTGASPSWSYDPTVTPYSNTTNINTITLTNIQ